MKFSLRWLQQIVDLNNIKFSTLVDKLSVSGFEVEDISRNSSNDDMIFDVTTTANRQDILCTVGLAREISSIFNRDLKYKLYKDSIAISTHCLNILNSVSLLDLSIVNVNYFYNNRSPLWLQYYLSSYNIKSLNLLTDIPQYIYLKWGQSIEIFDKNKISSVPIQYSLFNLQKKSHIIYDSPNIELEVLRYDDVILFPIGFSLNENIKCDAATNSIVIMGYVCDKQYITDIKKKLKLSTYLSQRCCNQGSRSDFLNAFYESVYLLGSFGFATLGKFYGYHKLYNISRILFIDKVKIQNILGSVKIGSYNYLTVKEIFTLLERLNFLPIYDSLKSSFKIHIPVYRQDDIVRPIDVIEEVARIYGFDNFISKLPLNPIDNKNIFLNNIFANKVYRIRYLLRCLGLHEAQNYSFYDYYPFNHDTQIKIYNPLAQDQSFLRSSLAVHLTLNQQDNLRQGNKDIEVFEIGKVFRLYSSSLEYDNTLNSFEFLHLSGLIANSIFLRPSWSDKEQSLSWFHAKGMVEEFLDRLEVPVVWKKISDLDQSNLFFNLMHLLNMNWTAIICNRFHEEIGIFGKLCNKSDFNSTYVFEFDLVKLIASIESLNHINSIINPYSSYPSLTRDISLTVKNSCTISFIKARILSYENNLIESIEVFNYYKDKSINAFYNVGLRIVYRAHNRTLNYSDINRIDQEIDDLLNEYKL
uniref:Phenylalanine--tRNA ligase beta subunit, chloroplastic n=1 Tax=Gracilaria tenuistipitata var. liui TaxID=285951 RepID=SYFB_GRATL|nr:phenylalanyl-tRNA synthetase beta chain [Gracilaria tenuistipitata var. liui]Q6B8Z8.1 RecName: Full=Phenylalanine--tRNA ligase beta subunit, chloroplastic; AltName: Full=Phenylalanyl-tRNA synthetase beta subunit; Short=PheRS [Gracilaria tenuistipitata var. liui]AAT79637.1 phenylalanine tRNA synthetase [Gracilaria tenuistipitata var. liui]